MRILIADDSQTMRRIIRGALTALGVLDQDIVDAADGIEAVDKSAAGGFNVILMDWNMPGMEGIDAVRAIRGRGDKTPIVMCTSQGQISAIREAIEAGVNDYLVKPFTPEQLQERVRKITGIG